MLTRSASPQGNLQLGQLADKLGIPLPDLHRMHADAVDLYDANVNGWLARTDRRFLIRVLAAATAPASSGRSCPTSTPGSTTSTS